MPRVTITIDDDPAEGKVRMVVDPPAQLLKERVDQYGWKSLSPAEGIAIGVVAHVLEHAGPGTESSRSDLIIPRRRLIT